jgi:hypothetical protein
MYRHWRIAVLTTALAAVAMSDAAPRVAASDFGGLCDCGYMLPVRRAQYYNWNGRYAHSAYGQPVALVVPPTANLQTNWGWGVASSRVTRLEHQVQRNFPGPGPWGGAFRRTPAWPSDTTQFGVYYVRGPW